MDISKKIFEEFGSEYHDDQLERVVSILQGKIGDEFDMDEIELELGPDECIIIHAPDQSAPWYADPEGEYSVRGKKGGEDAPPEGPGGIR